MPVAPYSRTNYQGRDRLASMEDSLVDASLPNVVKALTYSASMVADCSTGGYFTIAATDTSAFTIAAPTNPSLGQLLSFDIKNSSGGSHGTISWNAAFLNGGSGTVGTGAFVTIANTKRRVIVFRYDGTVWVEVSRTADQ
jgi:hypothetical protein